MQTTINISQEALTSINRILLKGSDVLIKYKKNKKEIEILEQKNFVTKKIKVE